MSFFRKVLYKVTDTLAPSPDYVRALQMQREEAVRDLLNAYNIFNSARSNIAYLEEKIARIDKFTQTGTIATLSGNAIPITPVAAEPGPVSQAADPVLGS